MQNAILVYLKRDLNLGLLRRSRQDAFQNEASQLVVFFHQPSLALIDIDLNTLS